MCSSYFCLASFAPHYDGENHPYDCLQLYFVYSHCFVVFCDYLNVLHIHSAIDGHLGCFHLGTIINSVSMSILVYVFWEREREQEREGFHWCINPGIELLDHRIYLYLQTLPSFQNVLFFFFTNLFSYHLCIRSPRVPHLCQHLALSIFLFQLCLNITHAGFFSSFFEVQLTIENVYKIVRYSRQVS